MPALPLNPRKCHWQMRLFESCKSAKAEQVENSEVSGAFALLIPGKRSWKKFVSPFKMYLLMLYELLVPWDPKWNLGLNLLTTCILNKCFEVSPQENTKSSSKSKSSQKANLNKFKLYFNIYSSLKYTELQARKTSLHPCSKESLINTKEVCLSSTGKAFARGPKSSLPVCSRES